MKVKEPLLKSHSNAMIPHLRSYIVEKVEKEKDMAVLQQLYAVITPKANETFAEKFTQAKEQTERYCTPEIAEELEDEGYMIGKPYPFNDEEFDNIFYTYGLRLYKNMPLIEPLEYKELRKIKDFVIAIDTSGSTSGELVQRFLQKTYNILKSTESYFSRVNLHIIQCDAEIQEHVRITSEREFDDYIRSMEILGLGGTDFRPVFSLVDELVAGGEFSDLRGLIYFTDGFGTFPVHKPRYETVFVFLDNAYNNPEVPPWAMKLVLQDEEI